MNPLVLAIVFAAGAVLVFFIGFLGKSAPSEFSRNNKPSAAPEDKIQESPNKEALEALNLAHSKIQSEFALLKKQNSDLREELAKIEQENTQSKQEWQEKNLNAKTWLADTRDIAERIIRLEAQGMEYNELKKELEEIREAFRKMQEAEGIPKRKYTKHKKEPETKLEVVEKLPEKQGSTDEENIEIDKPPEAKEVSTIGLVYEQEFNQKKDGEEKKQDILSNGKTESGTPLEAQDNPQPPSEKQEEG